MAAGAGAQRATMAWPLALIYAALVLFASLFPFEGWREQGISPWVFFTARIPPAFSATLPPMREYFQLAGSGG